MKGNCPICGKEIDETEYSQNNGCCTPCFNKKLEINKVYLQIKEDTLTECRGFIEVEKQAEFLLKWKNLLYPLDLSDFGDGKIG